MAGAQKIHVRLDADRAYLSELRTKVERAVREGQTVAETVAFCEGMRYRCREEMAGMHKLNVESAYLELGSETDPKRVGWGTL